MNAGIEMETDPFADQLAAYSLGVVDPEEIDLLEAHLATCATCRAELERFRSTAAALAFSPEPVAEPAGHQQRFQQKLTTAQTAVEPQGHRERFLEKLEAQASSAPDLERVPAPRLPDHAAPRPPQPGRPTTRPWWQGRNPFGGWALAGALAVALLFAVAAVLSAQGAATEATGQLQAARQQLQTMQRQLAANEADQHVLAQLLTNPNARPNTLAGQVNNQAVQVLLWTEPGAQRVVLTTAALPTAPVGKVYELWLIKGQTTVAVDVLSSEALANGLAIFQVPGTLSDYQMAAITVESGKVDKPTSKPIIAGSL